MKMDAPRSPKVSDLRRLTGMNRVETVGTLELLWLFTMDQAPAGDIGKWADDDIEDACCWEGNPGELVAALVSARWLDRCRDHRMMVHDWAEHAPTFLKKRVKRRQLEFATLSPDVSDRCPDSGNRGVDTVRHREGKGTGGKGREYKGSEGSESKSPAPRSTVVSTEQLWSEVNDARNMYLPGAVGLKLTAKRRSMIDVVRAELGETAHVDLVHGYIAFHLKSLGDPNGFDPMGHFTPETFWKADRGKYYDADQAAQATGLTRPYTPDQIVSDRADPVAEIMERYEQRKNDPNGLY